MDKAPLEPVASSLVLRQQFSPPGPGVGEPVIRTLTLVMEGTATACHASWPRHCRLFMKPDGEQQQERFVVEGAAASNNVSGARP